MDADRWERLSPLLDAMFDLEPDERERSLVLLREEDPQLAADLEELMALEGEREDFLSEPLIAPLPGARPGTVVGPYRLERMLGEGGMGQVWLAGRADGLYQRRVALKLLRPGLVEPNLRLRFNREREILARLAHPHIARLLDAGISHDGQPYLALEYIDGQPITDWCRSRSVPLEIRLKLFAQICAAVSHAHANLIVHRDLKPTNIMVTPAGEVRLLDFGIAKLLDNDAPAPEQTRTGVRAFTLHYAAPEQIRGEPVTTMTDVYSLGVVLYDLLADARPYRLKRDSDAAWEEAILTADPVKPSQALQHAADADRAHAPALRRRARELTGDLDNIVLKTLAKRPEQRYPSVEALALDLKRHRDGKPVLARPQSYRYRMHKFVSRHRWPLATAVLGTLVVAASLAVVTWQAQRALDDAARAQAMQGFVIGLFEHAGAAAPGESLDLRRLLDAGVDRGNRELARQPRARAELFGMIARLRLGLGDYREANELLDRQAQLLAGVDDAPPGLRLEAATLHGRSQLLLGQPKACIARMMPVLDQAGRVETQLASQAAAFYSQLGRCHRANGERKVARKHYERALQLRDTQLGDQPGVAENLLDLAVLQADAGQHAEALEGLQAAMKHLQANVGDRHPLAITLLRNVGASQRALGRVAAAETAHAQALALSLELHGTQHPTTLAIRRQLAATYIDQGRMAQARQELEENHRLLLARLGPQHIEVGASYNALGLVAWEQGDLAAALGWLQRAEAIWRQPAARAQLPGTLFNQGMVLHAAGRDGEALAVLQESRALRASRYGASHPLLGDNDRLIGEVLAAQGRQRDALIRLQQAVRLTRAGYGPTHLHSRQAELALARHQALAGDPKALPAIDALAALEDNDIAHRRLRWRARAYAWQVRCARGQHERALAGFDALLGQLREASPGGGALTREAMDLRADCLTRAAAAAPAR